MPRVGAETEPGEAAREERAEEREADGAARVRRDGVAVLLHHIAAHRVGVRVVDGAVEVAELLKAHPVVEQRGPAREDLHRARRAEVLALAEPLQQRVLRHRSRPIVIQVFELAQHSLLRVRQHHAIQIFRRRCLQQQLAIQIEVQLLRAAVVRHWDGALQLHRRDAAFTWRLHRDCTSVSTGE